MTKYDLAVADAREFAERHRDASLPVMILIGKTDDHGDELEIKSVAVVTQFSQHVQGIVLEIAQGEAIPDIEFPKGQN